MGTGGTWVASMYITNGKSWKLIFKAEKCGCSSVPQKLYKLDELCEVCLA